MTFPAEEFEVFVRNYQDMVYTTALRLLKDPAEAQDMAQEAFLKAFDRFEDLKDSPTAGGWLKTVTRNLALNHLERHRNRYKLFSEFATEDGEPDWADPAQPGADAELYERAGTEELELALAALPTPSASWSSSITTTSATRPSRPSWAPRPRKSRRTSSGREKPFDGN